VPGTFAYSPGAGTLPGAGTQTLTVTFTPTDSADYTTAQATTTILVTKATPTLLVAGGGVYDGAPIPAKATVAGVVAGVDTTPASSLEGISPTLTYYAGGTATGTAITGPPTGAGTYTVVATFPGGVDYAAAAAQATFDIARATPVVSWEGPASIAYGAALGPSQLNATSTVPGRFSYDPGAGAVLSVGSHTLTATFTPDDPADYTTATTATTLVVAPESPIVTWSSPSPIVYGTALGSAQLDATANVPGSFSYAPARGTVLGAGTQTLSVTFTPDDSTDYGSVTATATIVVDRATPAITWGTPAPIVYGAALGPSQLDATADVPGRFAYTPGAGTVPGAGIRTLTATFTPTDAVDYATVTVTTTITVSRATPTITWKPPSSIVYGTALGLGQLDVHGGVPGTLSYSPAGGAVLGVGVHTLSVTLTPDDGADYNSATATASITVIPATPTVRVDDGGGAYDGSPFAATASVAGAVGGSGPALEGIAPTLTYFAGSTPSGSPLGGAPSGVGTYTVVAAFPGSADYAAATSPPVTFRIVPAPVAVALESSTGAAVFGQPVTLTATVAADDPGAGMPSGSVTFLDGGNALGTVALDGSGRAVLTVNELGLGGHTLTAVYDGDADRAGGTSGGVSESIGQGGAQIILVPHPVMKKKRVVSLSFTAEVQPIAPGGGVPTGSVTFLVAKKKSRKTLGTAALSGGQATLFLKAPSILNKSLIVTYAGSAGYRPAQSVIPKVTNASLAAMARSAGSVRAVRPAVRKAISPIVPAGPMHHRLSLYSH
jgi:hypothetical protein